MEGENYRVFSILASAGETLLSTCSILDEVNRIISNELAKSGQTSDTRERLRHIQNQLGGIAEQQRPKNDLLRINNQSAILLAYTFGDIYTPALALLTGGHITMEIWGGESANLKDVEKIIFEAGGRARDTPIFFRVRAIPVASVKNEPIDINCFLQIRRILLKVQQSLDLETLDILPSVESRKTEVSEMHKPSFGGVDPGTEFVLTDPHQWFCTCSEFLSANGNLNKLKGFELPGLSEAPSIFRSLLETAVVKFPKKLPVCSHLISVILLLLNWEVAMQLSLLQIVWFPSPLVSGMVIDR